MRTLLATLGWALFLAAGSPSPTHAVPITVVTVNDGPRDQILPRVSGDFVTYSSALATGSEVRYYQFSTGLDRAIPRAGTDLDFDFASSIHDGRIVFARYHFPPLPVGAPFTYSSSIEFFDIASGGPVATNLVPPVLYPPELGSPDITGTSVVYRAANLDLPSRSDIFHLDLVTGAVTQVSNSGLFDTVPRISPDGNVVVWSRCEFGAVGPGAGNCDVVQAVRTGTTFTVTDVANTNRDEHSPDTDGTLVAYVSDSGGTTGWDIFVRPVAGGPARQLALPGFQDAPSIAGNVVAFATTEGMMLYNLETDTLIEIPDGLALSGSTDLTLLPDGSLRLAWASFNPVRFDVDILAATIGPFDATGVDAPGSLALLGLGVATLACTRRTRRSGRSSR